MYARIGKRYAVATLICLVLAVGGDGMLSGSFGAPTAPFWQEGPLGQRPRIQAPNFADLAAQLQPAVVNISTTQAIKGPRRGPRGLPLPNPFGERGEGERDPFQEFFERFFGGGPLFNLNGEVVGINTAIVATGQGIGFATPINLAKEILTQLREKGRVTRGWFGVQVQEVTPELAKSFGLERSRGALVADVQPNSPAARAGIQRGDVIVAFNGRSIEDMHELPRVVANTPPGSAVEVRFLRQGRERTARVNVGEMPEERRQAAVGGGTSGGELGLAVQPLTPEMARRLGLANAAGVVVSEVEEGSPADEVGIQRGDVILEVNHHKIANPQEYQAAIAQAGDRPSVLFLIRRGADTMYVALRSAE